MMEILDRIGKLFGKGRPTLKLLSVDTETVLHGSVDRFSLPENGLVEA